MEAKTEVEIKEIPALKILKIKFPQKYIDDLNEYIDDFIIPANESFSHGLVGQLNQDKRSAQLTFPLDTGFGKRFKKDLEELANIFLQKGYDRLSKSEAFSCWTNHAYSGDYNPFHSHGVSTMAGFSSFLYLKVPKCISEVSGGIPTLNGATGQTDGWTQLIWGTNTRKELYELKEQEQEFVKPVVGLMILFPNWLNHLVHPFFGEGERRTLAANFNIYDSKEEMKKYMSKREKELFDNYMKEKNIAKKE